MCVNSGWFRFVCFDICGILQSVLLCGFGFLLAGLCLWFLRVARCSGVGSVLLDWASSRAPLSSLRGTNIWVSDFAVRSRAILNLPRCVRWSLEKVLWAEAAG